MSIRHVMYSVKDPEPGKAESFQLAAACRCDSVSLSAVESTITNASTAIPDVILASVTVKDDSASGVAPKSIVAVPLPAIAYVA